MPNPFEDRLRALAARGFRVSVDCSMPDYGQHKGQVVFNLRLSKGDGYTMSGLQANGTGPSLDEAASAALRAGEVFIRSEEAPRAIEHALGDMAIALPQAVE